MQTQYRLLYRYLNESTNTPVTNESEYIKTEEFYNDGHKLNLSVNKLKDLYDQGFYFKYMYDGGFLSRNGDFNTQTQIADVFVGENQNDAESERENLIMENMANEKKSNNLYIYTGTKKTYKKQYIPEQLGYVVRDYTKVPVEQIPDGPEDYSKHFVMIGGEKLGFDGAYLVCKPQYINVYKKRKVVIDDKEGASCFICISASDMKNKGYKHNSTLYHSQDNGLNYIDDISKLINEEVFFKWYDPNDETIEAKYGETAISGTIANQTQSYKSDYNGVSYLQTSWSYSGTNQKNYYLFFNNQSNDPINHKEQLNQNIVVFRMYTDNGTRRGYNVEELIQKGYIYYGECVTVNEENIMKDIIPAHYEDTGSTPYYIKDAYEKINLSPWIQHSVHNSLESALTSARKLVSMIGIDNVKLIKYVPFDQFINIK